MADWSPYYYGVHTVINSGSLCTGVGEALAMANSASQASTVWPAAAMGIFVPFYLERPATVYQMSVENGATVAGNIDMGVYDELGNLLVSKGLTAQAGASTIQLLDLTDTVLGPGTYFMALSSSLATATFARSSALDVVNLRACGVQQPTSASALPSTLTFTAPTAAYLPNFNVHLYGTV